MEQQNKWYEFYRKRVNSGYQNYFVERYAPMIKFIGDNVPKHVRISEEGIGIGSLARALYQEGFHNISGFDINEQIVELCRLNAPNIQAKVGCIFNNEHTQPGDVVVTHGVIEHFSDEQIENIFRRYRKDNNLSFHYVPLDKYKTPSFGDERLLSPEFWKEISGCKNHLLFNEGHDMLIIL